jgi:hypothetical protein
MKMIITSLACATLLLGVVIARSEPDKTKSSQKLQPAKAAKVADVRSQTDSSQTTSKLTGSYIKRTYRRNGQITDGPCQVVVIDRETIEHSGATDLRELLIRKGLRR